MTAGGPVAPIVDGVTPLAQTRITRLYDALCHAPSGGIPTNELAGRAGLDRRMAHRLLTRMQDACLVWSSLEYPPVKTSRTGVVRMWWHRSGTA